ncbi:hypothetical protein TWF694_008064 [Orbilia ellipsospora]|uniref:Uncharacterized protein n=1 Tax=Orbilia ellipsospora TaxID=2528407 RepID=A0AAV9XG82_9PEZI
MASGYPSYRAVPVQPTFGGIEDHNHMGNGIAERYAYDQTPKRDDTICGFRRRNFFIVLGVLVVLVIAGLATGLGVALSSKNKSPTTQQSGSGAQENSGTSSITNTPTTSGGTSATSKPGFSRPQASSSSSGSPGSSPSQTSTKSSETTSAPATTSGPAVANAFALSTGIHSFTLTGMATAGNIQLCAYLSVLLAQSTVLFPTIAGNAQSAYTATYNIDGISGGVTATGTPSSSGTAPSATVWYFDSGKYEYTLGQTFGTCAVEANSAFTISENGDVAFQALSTIQSSCNIENILDFNAGDNCKLSYSGTDTNPGSIS